MHFYLVEYHPYARCFSFIAKYPSNESKNLKNAFFSDIRGAQLTDSWVEIKIESGELILAGACMLRPDIEYKNIYLTLSSCENKTTQIAFPAATFVDASIVSIKNQNENLIVNHWAKDSMSDCVVNSLTATKIQHQSLKSGPDFISSSFIKDTSQQLKIKTLPPQSLPVLFDSEMLLEMNGTDAKILALKDIHLGQEAWLIGNGPSVDIANFSKFENDIVFAFNRFYLAYNETKFRPTYVISGDEQMIRDFGKDIVNKSECQAFLAQNDRPDVDGNFFWLRQLNTFPPLFSLDPNCYVTPGGSSPFVAMQLAAFMGIKKLNLYGFDFNYKMLHQHDNNDSIKVVGEGNHFIQNYRDGKNWYPPSYRNIAHAFWNARLYYESIGGEIVNRTPNSNLNIFNKEALA